MSPHPQGLDSLNANEVFQDIPEKYPDKLLLVLAPLKTTLEEYAMVRNVLMEGVTCMICQARSEDFPVDHERIVSLSITTEDVGRYVTAQKMEVADEVGEFTYCPCTCSRAPVSPAAPLSLAPLERLVGPPAGHESPPQRERVRGRGGD